MLFWIFYREFWTDTHLTNENPFQNVFFVIENCIGLARIGSNHDDQTFGIASAPEVNHFNNAHKSGGGEEFMQFGREEEEPTYVGTSSKFAIGKERNRLLVSEVLKIVMNTTILMKTKVQRD